MPAEIYGNAHCSKCGRPCPEKNDVRWLDAYYFRMPKMVLSQRPKHLLPVVLEDGTVVCTGSPDEAQFLKEEAGTTDEHQRIKKEAYRKLQEDFPDE